MFNSTYGAGYRAGMAEPDVEMLPDGTKVLIRPTCPFRRPLQFISRELWHMGLHDGMVKRLSLPIKFG